MKRPRKGWFIFWMIWLSTFLVFEGIALLSPERGDTLSEQIWFLQRGFWPLTVGLAVLIGWLFYHFVIDKRTRNKRDD